MDQAFSTTRPLFGQVAVVTGSSRGIGRSIAIGLAKAGAQVVINYRTSEQAAAEVAEVCHAYGSRAITVKADITDATQVDKLVNQALTLGSPSILVNNAGISTTGLLIDTTVDEWNALLQHNLTAPFLCAKAVLPHMLTQGYGRIVNISSIWGLSGGSYEVAYSASKGGLLAFTKALAKEVARSGITVNAVAPGAIETEMLDNISAEDLAIVEAETPVGRVGQPADVTHAVLFLASPSASYMTGQVISPNGGLVT